MDVALLALNGDGVAMAQASERRFVIEGVMRSSSADGEAAQVFSWLLGDFTPNARVTSLPTAVHFGSSVRGLIPCQVCSPRTRASPPRAIPAARCWRSRMASGWPWDCAWEPFAPIRCSSRSIARSRRFAVRLAPSTSGTTLREVYAYEEIAILLLTAFLTRPVLAGDEAKEGVKPENAVNSSTRGQQKAPDQPPQSTKPTCPLATLVNDGGCAPKVENQAARFRSRAERSWSGWRKPVRWLIRRSEALRACPPTLSTKLFRSSARSSSIALPRRASVSCSNA